MIDPYSNWQGPVWINVNYFSFIALKCYRLEDEAGTLAGILARLVLADIRKWGSMHECYDAETAEGSSLSRASKRSRFSGICRLESQDMLQCEINGDCLRLD
jgi:hypothetical protein